MSIANTFANFHGAHQSTISKMVLSTKEARLKEITILLRHGTKERTFKANSGRRSRERMSMVTA